MPNIITYLQKIFEQIINLLLPKEAKVKFLENLGPNGLSEHIPKADNSDLQSEKLQALFNYKNSYCRQAIWEIKYRANKKLIRDFSLLLYDQLISELSDLKTFQNFKSMNIIPVPSSRKSQQEKGFNQCFLIGQELIKIDRERKQNTFILCTDLLIKKIETPHQTKVRNRKNRLENLQNTFTVNKKYWQNKSTQIELFILIDDVITTGATMTESFRALQEAGASNIIGLALAH